MSASTARWWRRAAASTGAAALLAAAAGPGPAVAAPAARGSTIVGRHPLGLVTVRGMAYAALDRDGLAVLDPRSGRTRRAAVGPGALDVAVDARRGRVYVLHLERRSGSGGAVSALRRDGTVLRTVSVGRGPTGIAVEPRTGLVYAANWTSQSVSVIDPASGTVRTVGGRDWHGRYGWPTTIVAAPGGRMLVTTTDGFVLALRGRRLVDSARILPSSYDAELAVDAGRGLVYAAHYPGSRLTVFDARSLEVRRTLALPEMTPESVAVDPRLGVVAALGLTRPDDGAARLAFLESSSGRVIGHVDLGIGASDVTSVPGSWAFYVSNSWGDDLLEVAVDGAAPEAAVTTERSTFDEGTRLRGTASDDLSGIAEVRVTYADADESHDVRARLRCENAKCRWSAPPPPSPGAYSVTVVAVDRARNVQEPGWQALLTWTP